MDFFLTHIIKIKIWIILKYEKNSYPFTIFHIEFPLFLDLKSFLPHLQTKNCNPHNSKRNNPSSWHISSTTNNVPPSYSDKSSKIKIVTKIRLFSKNFTWVIVFKNVTAYLRFTVTFLHSFCQTYLFIYIIDPLRRKKYWLGQFFSFEPFWNQIGHKLWWMEVLYFIHSDFVYIHHPSETCRHHMFSKSKIHPINLIFFIGDDESNHSLTIERKNETKLV